MGYGQDIMGTSDLGGGRIISRQCTDSLFTTTFRTLDNNSRLQFVLESNRKNFKTASGSNYNWSVAVGYFSEECRVQEYIFNLCHF